MNRFISVRLVWWLFLGTLVISNTGCVMLLAGGAAGAAGYAYAKGEKKRHYDSPPLVVGAAAEDACREMGLALTKVNTTPSATLIQGETATGKSVRIEVKPQGKGSVAEIRVGSFGDESMASLFFTHLEQGIPKTTNHASAVWQKQSVVAKERSVVPASATAPDNGAPVLSAAADERAEQKEE